MAKFLATKKISSEIEDILKSKQKITLISPYLKLSKDFRELLKLRNDKEIKTTIIFGKQELNHDELSFLMGQRSIYLKFYETLHGKCYFNDDTMIITSMNLHEYSMQNNKEFGILLKKNESEDKRLFQDVLDEIEIIESNSKEFEFRNVQKGFVRKEENNANIETNGFCIRCQAKIKIDPEHPYCLTDYRKWKKFEDKTYIERSGVCHICGKSNVSSMEKPVCAECYKKNKNLFKNF